MSYRERVEGRRGPLELLANTSKTCSPAANISLRSFFRGTPKSLLSSHRLVDRLAPGCDIHGQRGSSGLLGYSYSVEGVAILGRRAGSVIVVGATHCTVSKPGFFCNLAKAKTL